MGIRLKRVRREDWMMIIGWGEERVRETDGKEDNQERAEKSVGRQAKVSQKVEMQKRGWRCCGRSQV